MIVACLGALPAWAQEPQAPPVAETIQVTATRIPEDVEKVPASVTVITGEEIAARGATDLTSALALVGGVAIAQGGDSGPASSVPELWGLREFDAFLLVVDGVPWGGAFNPALPDLDLTDVDRIEVMRGSAPVMFGATSFVGVIQVIHRAAGTPGGTVRGSIGNYNSGDVAVSSPLPTLGDYKQSFSFHGDRQGFKDERSGYDRADLRYRGLLPTASGSFHIDVDTIFVRQRPASPIPRDGAALTPLVPLDSNQNPFNAHIDDNKFSFAAGYDTKLAGGTWSTTLSYSHLLRNVGRGFLENFTGDDPDDHGIRQDLRTDDIYFDSHLAFDLSKEVRLIAGIDHLYGKARNKSEDWDYFQPVDGSNPPNIDLFSPFGATDLKDTRNFSGLYLQTEWDPTSRWHFQVGGRLNHTQESLDTTSVNFQLAPASSLAAAGSSTATLKDINVGPGSARRVVTRGSAAAGASFLALEQGSGGVWLYGDYRNTFKPAALDFGPDVNGVILKPETAQSYEGGLKGRHLDGRFEWDVEAFQMDFTNLVVGQLTPDGLPELVNAGKERFKGLEVEVKLRPVKDFWVQAVYSNHDARFRDFIDVPDSTDIQVAGNRLPLSARDMGAFGFTYRPASGLTAWTTVSFTGKRFLDRENEALVGSFNTVAAGLGYLFAGWELRLDGWNLNNTRPPIAASEFGPDQFYILPARSFRFATLFHF